MTFVEFGGPLSSAAAVVRNHRILYSPSDTVLALGFPIGEALAFESFFPSAIGWHGEPALLWGASACQQMNKSTGGYSHGDYWYESESAAIARDFVDGVPPPTIASRATPTHATPVYDASQTSPRKSFV